MSKMKALANKTLQQRIDNYIKKVNEVGNYKYIDGYTKASDKVRAIHLACGNEIYVSSCSLLRKETKYCSHCEPNAKHKSMEYVQEQLNILYPEKYTLLKRVSVDGQSKIVIKCNICGHTYRTTFANIKKGQFHCCSEKKLSVFTTHVRNFSTECFRKMKRADRYLFAEKLRAFIEYEADQKKYIITEFLDREKFIEASYDYIMHIYDRQCIAECEVCGNAIKGKGKWKKEEYYEARICHECSQEEYFCHDCGEYKTLDEFYFNYEKKEFETTCKKCMNLERKLKIDSFFE